MGWDYNKILNEFTNEKNPPFQSKKVQDAFKGFLEQYPKFTKEVKFAKKADCIDSIPTTAIIQRKETK